MVCFLQRVLQVEARRSAENFQRLPALLAAALPVTDVTALQMLPEAGNALRRPPPAAQLAPADRAWLQSLLESAMQQAANKVLEAQVPCHAYECPETIYVGLVDQLLPGVEVGLSCCRTVQPLRFSSNAALWLA